MIKKITAMSALLLPLILGAQNMDPQVTVTRKYSTQIESSGGKAVYNIIDPEGVKDFNIDFDYSVFETKYLGSYDFSPYLISVNPETPTIKENTVYLRAGAGYTLHPEVEFIWSPVLFSERPDSVRSTQYFKRLRFNLYGSHNSYVGRYHDLSRATADDEGNLVFKKNKDLFGQGSDLDTKLGASICYDGLKSNFVLAADYENIGSDTRVYDFARQFNSLNLSLNLKSHSAETKHIHYDIYGAFRTSGDNVYGAVGRNIMENDFDVAMTLGQVFDMSNSLLVKTSFEGSLYNSTTDDIKQNVYRLSMNPRYKLQAGVVDLTLGAKFSYVWTAGESNFFNINKGLVIAPDVMARVVLKEKSCILWAGVSGDNILNTNASMAMRYHLIAKNEVRNTRIPYSAKAGLTGNLFKFLDYKVYCFYTATKDGILPHVTYSKELVSGYPELYYTSYDRAGARAEFAAGFKAVRFYTDVEYGINRFGHDLVGNGSKNGIFLPAAWTSYSSVDVNVSRRITLGLDLDFRSSMTATSASGDKYIIPHFENLGMKAEFQTARNFSFWLRGRNLLCQAIQYLPLESEKGVSVTAGVTCRF